MGSSVNDNLASLLLWMRARQLLPRFAPRQDALVALDSRCLNVTADRVHTDML